MDKVIFHEKTADLEKRIGYTFQDKSLLQQALTHSSYANERKINKIACNERLEFLGDAVLEMFSSDYIFRHFPKLPEGDLSRLRASLVCETALAECAKFIELGTYIYLGKGEDAGGGREKASVTSDAFEALIGAIYLDGGVIPAQQFILEHVLIDVEKKCEIYDSKSILQEIVQQNKQKEAITYEVVDESGPEHEKEFVVEVKIGDRVFGRGNGHNKKNAEKMAAYEAIQKLKN